MQNICPFVEVSGYFSEAGFASLEGGGEFSGV